MTEKEKMLSGAPYNSRNPDLLAMYHRARKLTKTYNELASDQLAERVQVLEELLGFRGEGVWIEAPFYCDYGSHISIGENTFVNSNCMFLDDNEIIIGKNGLFAPCVQIYTATHPIQSAERIIHVEGKSRYITSSKPVTIGDNV